MLKKRPKTKNQKLVSNYRLNNQYCEPCAILCGEYPVRMIEIHHLAGGNDRTDELWNLISVCKKHHEMATTHNLKYGSDAHEYNSLYAAIKYLKGEMTVHQMREIRLNPEIVVAFANVIEKSEPYMMGSRLGWFV